MLSSQSLAFVTWPILCAAIAFGSAAEGAAPAQEVADRWVEQVSAQELGRSLFTVQVTYDADKSYTQKQEVAKKVQVGFLVGPNTGITPYSALVDAKTIKYRDAKGRPLALKVIGADPKLDLAVLRLKPENLGEGRTVDAASKESEELEALDWSRRPLLEDAPEDTTDADLWALVWDPRSSDASYAAPIADLLVDSGEGYVAEAGRMHLLAGLPIVDGAGRLAAVWRWAWPAGEGMPIETIDVGAIRRLVARFGPGKEVKSHRKTYGGQTRRSYAFPVLAWPSEPSKSQAASRTKLGMRSSSKFGEYVVCRECHGSGEEVRTTTETGSGRPKTREKRTTCPDCDGGGILLPPALWSKARNLAANLSQVPQAEKYTKDVLRRFEEGVMQAASVNLNLFVKRIRDSAIQALEPSALVPGRSLLFTLPRSQWPAGTAKGWSDQVLLIRGDYGPMILMRPTTRNVAGESQHVMVSGTVAGYVTVDDEDWVVVERAMAVPIKSDGERTGR